MNSERNFQYSEMVKTVNQMRCAAQSENVNLMVTGLKHTVHSKELPIQIQ